MIEIARIRGLELIRDDEWRDVKWMFSRGGLQDPEADEKSLQITRSDRYSPALPAAIPGFRLGVATLESVHLRGSL